MNDDTVLSVIMLVILIIFFLFILSILIESNFQVTTQTNRVPSDKRPATEFTCPTGTCPTNIVTGVKTCPQVDQPSPYDPQIQVCNSKFRCDNPLTPFALLPDGSTTITGVCENNTSCPCLKVTQCPNYILSVFTTSGGNPFQSLQGQRITFPQESTFVGVNGVRTTVPPIQYNNPATTFCAAPISWLPLANPGCNFVAEPNSITYADIVTCMGLPRGCTGGVITNPCLQGTLAFISNNPDALTQAEITTTQLGCVRGEPCPCGQVAIFDTNYGNVVCKQLPL